MAHTRRLFVTGSFAVLESAALQLLRSLKQAAPPLAPLWVVVPTNLLRVHLARAVVSDGPGHVNLRFLTLLDLARELAESELLAAGARPLSDTAAIALIRRLAAEHPVDYFRALLDRPGFHAALLATFRDLADGEVDPALLQHFVSLHDPGAEGSDKLAALAELYQAYRHEVLRLGLYDANDLLRAASDRVARQAPPGGQIVFYGFYDLTALQRRLVAATAGAASVIAFMPWEGGPRFAYATDTYSWFRSEAFEVTALASGLVATTDLERAQASLFGDATSEITPSPPASERSEESYAAAADEPDGTLEVLSAPGESREAREVTRAVLRLARTRQLRFPEIGVLLRGREPYGSLIVESLEDCGVPVYLEGGRPLSQSRAGRALILLLRILRDDFARPAVVEFLTTAPVPFASLLDDGDRCSPAQWDLISAEAGVVAGRSQWRDRLASLHRRYRTQREQHEEPPAWLAARLAEIERCQRFMEGLGGDLDAVARVGTWRDLVETLLGLFDRYVERSEGAERVRAAVASLTRLDAVAASARLDDVLEAVSQSLEDAQQPVGEFGHGVFVGDIMQARGLSFRATVLPGMVERGIPSPIREDPLLLDEERDYLGVRTGRAVQQKNRGFDEERLLFTLMLRSARERAVLTFPRLDMANARERLPSFFLLHVFAAVTGRRAGYQDLERWNRVRRVDLSRLFPSAGDEAIDHLEVDLAHADAAVRANDPAPLGALLSETPFMRPACRAEAARHAPMLTTYDGLLAGQAARERLSACEWTLSTRRLQSYLRCPHLFFLEHVLGIEAVDEPERVQSISALDRGNLVHAILHEFYRRAAAAAMVPLRAADAASAVALVECVAGERLAEFEAEGLAGFPLLWRRERARLLASLREFVDAEIAGGDEFVPTHFELAFGDGDRVVRLALPCGEMVKLRGRIDRIDVAPGRRGRVIDYKTGKPTAVAGDVIEAATIQLPFYLHAVRTLFPSHLWERADLYYVSADAGFRRSSLDASASSAAAAESTLAAFVAAVLAGIRSGWFVAGTPTCAYCKYAPICGRAAAFYAAKTSALAEARDDPA